ncbi:hypothetical protein [Coleofasciculus sp. FACHB-T130]|uniref:ParM/StbA family protein n=1 Tax=Cyanophyceae TaxID=3028117 RepID=UPI00168229D4|nr:hypothetical protein [Coleofasciculus sp. FACHB-T130]MBD1879083.1 hypothetical protein [Coleofasciculus sp. FACHB-T130]
MNPTNPISIKAKDIGYRFAKDYNGSGVPTLIESLYCDLHDPRSCPALDANSCRLVYEKANNVANERFERRNWLIGSAAKKNPRGYKRVFNAISKADPSVSLRMALAGFVPMKDSGEESINVDHLYVSLPETENGAELLSNTLTGHHRFRYFGKRKNVLVDLNINNVVALREEVGSFWYARAKGLTVEGSWTAIVGIGGKTCNLLVVDENGDPLPDACHVFGTGGTYDLALQTSQDWRLRENVRGAISLDDLMDAIAAGSYYYGVNGFGANFQEWFDDHRFPWFDAIVGELETRIEPYRNRIGRILFVGGSANLIADIVAGDDFLVVVPEAQTANVVGMWLKAKNDLTQSIKTAIANA